MEEPLYLRDPYKAECNTRITFVNEGRFVSPNDNLFYPRGGGQPSDTGSIYRGEERFEVVSCAKANGNVLVEVNRAGLAEGDRVRCVLDWDRRYKLMRSHTAAHTLATVLHKETGALITGNQLETDKVRFDFALENFDRAVFENCISKANELFLQDIPVKVYHLPRDEAMKIPGIVKLAGALPPNISNLRIVEIEGVDIQADGGTHVRNLKEVGQIEMVKAENKGANNRRVYFRLKE